MFVGDFQIFQHAFPDGYTRHNDHKFFKAVLFVEFVNGSQIHVCFAGPGLHFNREVHAVQFGNRFNTVSLLNFLYVFQDLFVCQYDIVSNTIFR